MAQQAERMSELRSRAVATTLRLVVREERHVARLAAAGLDVSPSSEHPARYALGLARARLTRIADYRAARASEMEKKCRHATPGASLR